MERKQKEQLDVLLKARKRADKVLEQRREAEQKKHEHNKRKAANLEKMKQYTRELTALAEESGILALVEEAARERGASLRREVGYYMDYGFNSSNLQRAIVMAEMGEDIGKLRASHLGFRITWEDADAAGAARTANEAEVRVHKNGVITFHNSMLPVLPFVWRMFPRLLEKMFSSAMNHPRPPQPREKRRMLHPDDSDWKL